MLAKIKAFVMRWSDWIAVGALFVILLSKHWMLMSYLYSPNGYTFHFLAYLGQSKAIYLISSLAVIVMMVSIVLLFKGWKRWIAALSIDIFFTVCVAVDFVYARAFYSLPSFVLVYLYAENESTVVGGSITSLLWWTDLLFIVDFLALIPVCILSVIKRKKNTEPAPKSKKRFIPFLAAFLSCAFILGVFQGHDLFAEDEDDFVSADDLMGQAVAYTSAGFHLKDLVSVTFGLNEMDGLNRKQLSQLQGYNSWKNADTGAETAPFGQFAGKNVLFLQVESLEDFVIGADIGGQEITPNFNRLLSHSYRFTNLYEQVKGGNSSDCDLMLMTSLLPIENGPTFALYGDATFNSLPDILRKYGGYVSGYYNGEKNSMWNYEQVMSKTIPFDDFCMDYEQDVVYNYYVSDESMLTQTLPHLVSLEAKAGENPYYAHIVLCSTHMPFFLPEEEWRLDLPENMQDNYMGGYLQCMAYTDYAIGKFLEQAKEAGLLEDTVVVITGDHGGVHKYYPQWADGYSEEYTWMGSSEDYKIPLLIYSPDITGKSIDLYCGHVDVMPSLLHLLGVDPAVYQDTAMGRNLFSTARNFVVQPNGRIRGEYSEEDKTHIEKMYVYSDWLIRGVYAMGESKPRRTSNEK